MCEISAIQLHYKVSDRFGSRKYSTRAQNHTYYCLYCWGNSFVLLHSTQIWSHFVMHELDVSDAALQMQLIVYCNNCLMQQTLGWLTRLCRRGDTELHYREAYHSEADRWQVTSDQAWDLVRSMHPSWQRNNRTHTRAQGRQPQLHANSQASVHSRSSHGAVSLENRANGPARWAQRSEERWSHAEGGIDRGGGGGTLCYHWLAPWKRKNGVHTDDELWHTDTGRRVLPARFLS